MKILKKIYNWLKPTRVMNPIDQEKVIAFLTALNTGNPGLWIELTGTDALMRVDVNENGGVFYHTTEGFPVKGFLNTQTGEIKLITARRFSRS